MPREFQNPGGSQNDASAKSYRFDTAKHAANRRPSSEVPVLFRLQNLQKSPDFAAVAPATAEKKSPELSMDTKRQDKSGIAGAPKAAVAQTAETVSAPAAASTVPNPITDRRSSSSRPWSTNVILLGIGFAVVGLLVKSSGSNSTTVAINTPAANTPSNAVAAVQPQTTDTTSSNSQTTKPADLLVKTDAAKPEESFSIAPLAAPKLPAPMVLSLSNESNDALSPSSETANSNGDASDATTANTSVAVSSESTSNSKIDESLTIGSPTQSSIDFNQPSPAPRSTLKSVAIPNSVTSSDQAREPEFTQTNFANGAMSPSKNEKSPSGSTVITNPHVLEPRDPIASTTAAPPQIISTSTPDLETEELFKLRMATMESQQQAMAIGRQPVTSAPQQQVMQQQVPQQQPTAQWNPASGSFGPNATMVSGPMQPSSVYVSPAVQSPSYNQPVQPAPQGYGVSQVYGAPPSYGAPQAFNVPAKNSNTVNPPPSNTTQNSVNTTAPASVRQPYVPISGSFNPDRFGLPENVPSPTSQSLQPTGQNSTPIPVSGGYQPLSPQFQYQPTNGN
jgi:hypothetical protein